MLRGSDGQTAGMNLRITGVPEAPCSVAFAAAIEADGDGLHGIVKRCGPAAAAATQLLAMPRFDFPVQRLPRYLPQEETRSFFQAIDDPRGRTLFTLIYLYGLRVAEVGLLTRGDVDLTRSRIVIKRLKGGAWAERPLFSTARRLLEAHFGALRAAPPEAPLFPGNGGPLRKRQIQTLFTRYRNAAGLPRTATAHSLRHSIATHLLDAGVSLEFVQDHLGHQSIRSTSVYARITDHHRAALFRQLEISPWIVHPVDSAPTTQAPNPRKETLVP